MEIKNKTRLIDMVIISATALFFIYFFGNINPLVIAPLNDIETMNSSVLFSFKNADYILLDDNLNFSSPEKMFAKDNLIINLQPGIYYWKIRGISESEIRKITIISKVDLRLRKTNQNCSDCNLYDVVNAGNEVLNVDVYSGENLSGSFVLNRDEIKNTNGTKFIGGVE